MLDHTFSAWRPRLLRFCTNLLRNAHDAEEVVQDVFARLVQHGGRHDLARDPGVLLFKMARNRSIDLLRRRAPQTGPEPPAFARDDGDARDLGEELARLPFEEREVLLLTTVDGLTYREVAAILGCSLGTVAARKYAAITRLQRRLCP